MHQQFGEMSQKKKVLISVFEHMYPEGGEAWGNYNSTQLTPEQMSMKMCLKKLKKMHWKKQTDWQIMDKGGGREREEIFAKVEREGPCRQI